MGSGLFITATDTCAGKTLVACALLSALAREGFSVAGFKPVAAGADSTPNGLRNDDALMLRRFSTVRLSYEEVNPVVLAAPIAPHIAARAVGTSISPVVLTDRQRALATKADVVITEGAGGWRVPLDGQTDMSDLAVKIGDPVVLVVGMRLGCLNHALLTAEAIRLRGAKFAGWVANRIDPDMPVFEENLESLDARLEAPRLGVLPWLEKMPREQMVERAIAALDVPAVIGALARA
jgi:dethiobiotin synthetase